MIRSFVHAQAEVLLAALVLVAIAGWMVADRRRAVISRYKFVLRLHLQKALQDGNPMVRISAEQVVSVFKIEGVRTLPDPGKFAGKGGKHPAMVPPARRRKMGARQP